jgi:RNA polymerase sigma factor (sigma-70 family)
MEVLMTQPGEPFDPEVLRTHVAWVRSLARRLVDDACSAEDVAQQAWLTALRRPPRNATRLRAWLAVVVRHLAGRGRREATRRLTRERVYAPHEALPSAADLVDGLLVERAVVESVIALDEPYRTAIVLRYYHDLSPSAIAVQLGVPVATVKTHLARGLDRLRVQLDEKHGGDREVWLRALAPLVPLAGAGKLAFVAAAAMLIVLVGAGAWWLQAKASVRTPADTSGIETAVADEARAVEVGSPSRQAADPDLAHVPSATATSQDSITVTVLDRSNARIANVDVRCWRVDQEDKRVSSEERARTREDGTAVVPLCEVAGPIGIAVDADGYFHLRSHELREPFAVVLDRLVPVSGRVLDAETRAPVAGAVVSTTHVWCDSCATEHHTTDEAGRFSAFGLPAGRTSSLCVTRSGYPVQSVAIELHDDGYKDILLDRGCALSGVVVDLETGLPIAGARLRNSELESLLATSDAEGRFAILVLPSLEWATAGVTVEADGYCGMHVSLTRASLADPRPRRFPLLRSIAIEGRVVDESDEPIEAAWVRSNLTEAYVRDVHAKLPPAVVAALDPEWQLVGEGGTNAFVRSDAEGRFRLAGLLPWFDLEELHARAEASCEDGGTASGALPGPITVRLKRGGTIEGTIRVRGVPYPASIAWHHALISDSSLADTRGRYRLTRLSPGHGTLVARVGSSVFGDDQRDRSGFCRWVELDLEPGGTLVQDFDMDEDLQPLAGHVRSADGSAVVCADVVVKERSFAFVSATRTGAEGSWQMLVPNSREGYSVECSHGDRTAERQGVRAGDTDVDFVLDDRGTVRIRPLGLEPPTPFQILWRPAGTQGFETFATSRDAMDPGGGFVRQLPLGAIEIVAFAKGVYAWRVPPRRLDVLATENADVELKVFRGAPARFTFVPAPRGDHEVYLLEEEFADHLHAIGWPPNFGTDNSGVQIHELNISDRTVRDGIVIGGLAPGRYRLKVHPTDLRLTPEDITIEDGKTNEFTLTWER